jgi:electron transfer flavoprotein beta subunit
MTFDEAALPLRGGPAHIGVALKYSPLRVEVNPLTGAVSSDARLAGASPADEAALEHALRLADRWEWDVVVATTGSRRCEPMLRAALACGASRAVRVDLAPDAASPIVAAALSEALAGCTLVVCGDHSLDGGTGSVPAFLAAQRGAGQALGLVRLTALGMGRLQAERRLDGGRRERLRVSTPAVISVEPGGVRLRRATLPAVLRARTLPVELLPPPVPYSQDPAVGTRRPYRPRPKTLSAPACALDARERVLMLTGALAERRTPAVVRTTDPDRAADALLGFLRERGYLT